MSYQRQMTMPFGSRWAGLASTVQWALFSKDDLNGTPVSDWTNTGVSEVGTLTGNYTAYVTIPAGFIGVIRWRTSSAAEAEGFEPINPATNEVLDALDAFGQSYANQIRIAAAGVAGDLVEPTTHTSTTLYAVGDSDHATPILTTSQTTAARTVTLP